MLRASHTCQSQRKAMPKKAQTTAQLHSSHARARGREGGGLTRSRGGTGPVFCAPAEGGWAPGPASQQAITHPLPGLRPGLEALPGRPSSSLGPPALGRVAPAVPLQVHEAMAALALQKTRPSVEPPETPRAALPHPPSPHPAEVGTRAPTGPGPLRTCAGKTEVPEAGRSGLPRAWALGRSPGGPSALPGGALHPQQPRASAQRPPQPKPATNSPRGLPTRHRGRGAHEGLQMCRDPYPWLPRTYGPRRSC